MASNEWDRQLIPALFQTAFTISMGAAYRGIEMMKDPRKAFSDVSKEIEEMVTIPEDAGEGVEAKAKALAGVWMEKGISAMEACKKTGQKFTGDE